MCLWVVERVEVKSWKLGFLFKNPMMLGFLIPYCLDCLSATDLIISRVYFLQRVAARLWMLCIKVVLRFNVHVRVL